MLDFSSALYLAWRHPATSLGAWPALSLGKPAALEPVPGSTQLAQQLAQLQGCAAASICSSTLHLFWDVFQILHNRRHAILLDDACYPVIQWGVERSAAQGVPVWRFAAHQVAQAAQLVARCQREGRRPVLVTEGYAPSLSRAAPLQAYADLVRAAHGLLLLDDTQALGIFGKPDGVSPWGVGGGGSLQAQQVFGPHIVVGASLAKTFGAPLAVLAGSASMVQRFEACSQTRLHASPPSVAAVRAGLRALELNQASGTQRRQHLWRLLQHWWQGVERLGLRSHGGPFPVQTLVCHEPQDWPGLHRYLQHAGINALLQEVPVKSVAPSAPPRWQLSFIFHAEHRFSHLDWLHKHIANWLRRRAAPSSWLIRAPSASSAASAPSAPSPMTHATNFNLMEAT